MGADSIPQFADQCNVTLEGRCDEDVDECASNPCLYGSCDDTVSCARKLANDKRTVVCADGDDNCGFGLEPNEFMCTCEDNGLLGGYTSAEIGREPVNQETEAMIPTEMEPGLICDKQIGPNIFFFSMMGVLALLVLALLVFGVVVTRIKMKGVMEKKGSGKVHP